MPIRLRKKHILHTSNYGFTLIETLVFMSIFVVIVGILVSSLTIFYRSNEYNLEQAVAVNSARKGVELMVRELREVTFSEEGSYPIIDMSTTSISFYSDTDRDDGIERIRYTLMGNEFRRAQTDATGVPLQYNNLDEATSTVAYDVRNNEQGIPIFDYFNSEGNQILDMNSIADVAFVRVNLVVNINPIRLPNEFVLRSSATLRNLKTNL